VTFGTEIATLRKVSPFNHRTSDLEAVAPCGEAGYQRFVMEERKAEPIRLDAEFSGEMAIKELEPSEKLRPTHFASWFSKEMPVCEKGITYCDWVTYIGYGTVAYRDFGIFDATFPRNNKPNRGLTTSIMDNVRYLSQTIRAEREICGPCFCLGSIPNQFGHFLLEVIPRVWGVEWALRRGIPIYALHSGELTTWQRDLFELAGVNLDYVNWVATPAKMTEVYFADPLYRLHTCFHPEFRKYCAAMIERASARAVGQKEFPRVFLGRGTLKLRERLINERKVFDEFRKYGFELIYPETLSVAEQICLGAGAKHLAGPIGSQLYLSLFQMQGIANYIVASHRFCFADDAIIGAMNSIRCHYLFAEEIEVRRSPRDENFTINPQHVARVLAQCAELA